MAQNEGILEESDQIMEQEEFTEGTPSREVLLRVNYNKVHIGDRKDVNSGIQDSLCAVLSEIKSLKSHVNLLQSQANLTSDDTWYVNQSGMRIHGNTSLEGDQRYNIEQPNRNSSTHNFPEELCDHSATSGSNSTMSRSSTNDVRPGNFDLAFPRFETPREHVYGYEEASYARTGQAPDHVFRRQRPTKERKPAAFDGKQIGEITSCISI
jgi:hypothetical protein